MIRKLIIIIAIVVAGALIADHYGVITFPSLEKSTALKSRDQMVHKTKNALEDE